MLEREWSFGGSKGYEKKNTQWLCESGLPFLSFFLHLHIPLHFINHPWASMQRCKCKRFFNLFSRATRYNYRVQQMKEKKGREKGKEKEKKGDHRKYGTC